jgi:hypothetical protein
MRIAHARVERIDNRGLRPMTDRATRSELAQALAKAVAYRDCGKPADAAAWAAKLVKLLEAQQILQPEYR